MKKNLIIAALAIVIIALSLYTFKSKEAGSSIYTSKDYLKCIALKLEKSEQAKKAYTLQVDSLSKVIIQEKSKLPYIKAKYVTIKDKIKELPVPEQVEYLQANVADTTKIKLIQYDNTEKVVISTSQVLEINTIIVDNKQLYEENYAMSGIIEKHEEKDAANEKLIYTMNQQIDGQKELIAGQADVINSQGKDVKKLKRQNSLLKIGSGILAGIIIILSVK